MWGSRGKQEEAGRVHGDVRLGAVNERLSDSCRNKQVKAQAQCATGKHTGKLLKCYLLNYLLVATNISHL